MTDPADDPTPAVSQNVAVLRQSLASLVQESQSLRGDVHAAEKARRRTATVNLGVLVLLVVFVILVLTVTWQNNHLGREVRRTNEKMADCTTPGGKCYEEGTKRTSTVIGDIVRADIYVAECARLRAGESGPAFDRYMETCVTDKLAQAAKARAEHPTPAPSGP